MEYNMKREAWLRYQASVCRRTGHEAQAEKLEAQAEEILRAFLEALDKQAGV